MEFPLLLKRPLDVELAFDFPTPPGTVLRLIPWLKRGAVTIMRRLFAVIRSRGALWDEARALDMQDGWTAHAQFMNALAAEGFVVVGGPLEGTGDTLLAVYAESEGEIRRRLADDPWGQDMLKNSRIAPWSLRLGEGRLAIEPLD